jgi:cyclin H
MATEDARYRTTTQFTLWSFSKPKLAQMRAETNAAARATISEHLLSRGSRASSSANTPDPDSSAAPTPSRQSLPEFLTPEEEYLLLTFFTSELIRAGRHKDPELDKKGQNPHKFPTEDIATAAVFFRRFYTMNSIMTYPPKQMVSVALFCGAKAEGDWRKANTHW